MRLMIAGNEMWQLAAGSIGKDEHMDAAQVAGVLVAGLGVVFAALVLLVALIWCFGKLFEKFSGKKWKKEKAAVTAPKASVPVKAAARAPAVKAAVPVQEEEEIIAVIAAVVAMMGERDGKTYEVKSVRPAAAQRLSGRTAWAMDGRRQNIAPF